MLDEANLVSCRPDGIGHLTLETREAIHQGRDAPHDPDDISRGARCSAASRGWQCYDGGVPD
jgi:hypothetical protein